MPDLFDLRGQVIVVTGATGVLAGVAARYLLSRGARLALLSRNPDKVAATVADFATVSPDVRGFACDVTDREAVLRARDAVLAAFGRVDGLVNGAGGNMPGAVIPPDKSLFDLKLSDYQAVLDLNLTGTLIPTLAFGETMAARRTGSIVNFSSASSAQAITRVLGYSNAKAAVDNLTRWFATEFAQRHGDGIRVNAVMPGFFIGEQNRALLLNPDGTRTPRGDRIVRNTPMGRFGEADEVCGAIHYLLAPASKFVTGTVLAVDGGFACYSGV